jgi:hypothetical protein
VYYSRPSLPISIKFKQEGVGIRVKAKIGQNGSKKRKRYIMIVTNLEPYFTSISHLGGSISLKKKVKIIPLKVRKVSSSCEVTVLFCNFLCTI